jgi:exopolysaccharide biosynthesis polyprenyl glycosylphosphotransferase
MGRVSRPEMSVATAPAGSIEDRAARVGRPHRVVPLIALHGLMVAAILLGTQYLTTVNHDIRWAEYAKTAPIATLIFLCAFGYHLVYERDPYDTFTQTLNVIGRASLAASVGSMAAIYIGAIGYPRSALLLSGMLILLAVFTTEAIRLRSRLRNAPPRRAVVLGPAEVSQPIVDHFTLQPTASLAVVDRLDSAELAPRLAGDEATYDLVLIPGPRQLSHTPTRLLLAARNRGIRIFMLAGESGAFLGLSELHELGGLPWHELHVQSLPAARRAAKRGLDLLLVIGSAPVALVASAVVALAIRLEGRGQIVHRQRRSGLGGNDFTIYKFRTMRPDAEIQNGAQLAEHDDHRITRVGRFLRRHRLDELPQLWNVLRGDMSLVGPRPERPEFVASFQERVPDYTERHAVRPGITGLAQVLGTYDTPAEHKVRYDILYVANWSMWLDVQILLKTLVVVFRGTGSR